MVSRVIEVIPCTNSELLPIISVGNAGFTILGAHLDDVAPELRSLGPVVDGPWVSVRENGKPGSVGGPGKGV